MAFLIGLALTVASGESGGVGTCINFELERLKLTFQAKDFG